MLTSCENPCRIPAIKKDILCMQVEWIRRNQQISLILSLEDVEEGNTDSSQSFDPTAV